MKNKFFTILVAAIFSFALVGSASAAMITGSIGFTGDWAPVGGDNYWDATGISFVGNLATVDGDVSGSFMDEGILDGDPGTINGFNFSSASTSFLLWTIGDFSFHSTSFTVDKSTPINSPPTLGNITVTGTGIFSYGGSSDLEPNTGFWILTPNQGGDNFTWSNSNTADPIPEPATMLLFGTGLVGLVGLGRRKLRKN